MLPFLITARPDATDQEMQKIKDDLEAQGGKITQTYTIIKGFSCLLPEQHYSTFARHELVQTMERDGVVTTQ
ncbi:hypothetical protein C7212DRAFT_326297 [Tuber magnatum]|uniref:Inhibitor I9 domain-containing protein n=1 Tax=Tuber magnatum TaxID=42249 RepID=A0A317SPN1_9PEZI|nr:hypothetical protein C7212DRAFT_326297 [Tuber magnatum]